MLPVFMLEEISYTTPGVSVWPPATMRAMWVCDGNSLMEGCPNWTDRNAQIELCRKLVERVNEVYTRKQILSTEPYPFRISLYPIAHPLEAHTFNKREAGAEHWAALALIMDRQICFNETAQQNRHDYLAAYATQTAQEFAHFTGYECVALNGDPGFMGLRKLLAATFESPGLVYYKPAPPALHKARTLPGLVNMGSLVNSISERLPHSLINDATAHVSNRVKPSRL